jgi:hypothetical protein
MESSFFGLLTRLFPGPLYRRQLTRRLALELLQLKAAVESEAGESHEGSGGFGAGI